MPDRLSQYGPDIRFKSASMHTDLVAVLDIQLLHSLGVVTTDTGPLVLELHEVDVLADVFCVLLQRVLEDCMLSAHVGPTLAFTGDDGELDPGVW